jgi:hypothetical protein
MRLGKKFLRKRLGCFSWVDKTRSGRLDGPSNSSKKNTLMLNSSIYTIDGENKYSLELNVP